MQHPAGSRQNPLLLSSCILLSSPLLPSPPFSSPLLPSPPFSSPLLPSTPLSPSLPSSLPFSPLLPPSPIPSSRFRYCSCLSPLSLSHSVAAISHVLFYLLISIMNQ